MRLLLIAGGSGGHIFPALSVAKHLQATKRCAHHDLLFVCSRSTLDHNILSQSGFSYAPIFSGKLRRYFSWQNFLDPFLMVLGFFQSFFLLLRFRPDVIFSKGGFVALPILLAGKILKIPLIIHESDIVPGLSNRISARFAQTICTTFPSSLLPKKNQKIVQTGLPLRAELFTPQQKFSSPNFDPQKPLLFGFFGSQGSLSVNSTFLKIEKEIAQYANIIWVFGPGNLPQKKLSINVLGYEFLHQNFTSILQSSDLIIARSGSSFFEIAATKKAMILLPLRSAANNHQVKNAEWVKQQGAATISSEENPLQLQNDILHLLKNKEEREKMAQKSSILVQKGAEKKIGEEIFLLFSSLKKK